MTKVPEAMPACPGCEDCSPEQHPDMPAAPTFVFVKGEDADGPPLDPRVLEIVERRLSGRSHDSPSDESTSMARLRAAAHPVDHARAAMVRTILERCAIELASLEYDDVDADDQAALAMAKGFVTRAANVLRRFA